MAIELRERIVDVLSRLHGRYLGSGGRRGGRSLLPRLALDHMDGVSRLDLVDRQLVVVLEWVCERLQLCAEREARLEHAACGPWSEGRQRPVAQQRTRVDQTLALGLHVGLRSDGLLQLADRFVGGDGDLELELIRAWTGSARAACAAKTHPLC